MTQPYDTADYLTDDETILAYLQEAFETNEPPFIAKAIAAVARAKSRTTTTQPSEENSRQALAAVLREGESVDLSTALQALSAMGIKLTPALITSEPLAA